MGKLRIFLADVHGNIEALKAVIQDAKERGWLEDSTLYCIGDMVGYGACPGACLNELRRNDARAVLGNHDAAVLGNLSTERFNHLARSAIRWTTSNLSDSEREYLKQFPRTIVEDEFQCVHGSPSNPFFQYITDVRAAEQAVRDAERGILCVGHTHTPAFFRGKRSLKQQETSPGTWIPLDPTSERIVLNPGSVGQPRDLNPDASYMVLDEADGRIRWERVSYPVESTQDQILEAGLPEALAKRLAVGR